MIVERGHVGLIRSGRRTQSRVLVDHRDPHYRVRTGRRAQSHSLVKPWIPKVGDRVPIQTKGEKADLYVVATGVRSEPAGATTRADALACGYTSVVAWKAAWVREHGKTWVARERARQEMRAGLAEAGFDVPEQNIRAALTEAGDPASATRTLLAAIDAGDVKAVSLDEQERTRVLATLTAAQLAARFDGHHTDQMVWVIDHVVAIDEPFNLLAARPGSAGDDYVRSPTASMGGDLDPGEAVDRETVAKLGERDALRREQERQARWLTLRHQWEKGIAELEKLDDLTPSQQKHLDRLRHQLEGGDKRFIDEAA